MKALVVYGSKHGSTREIAERISRTWREEGWQASTADADGIVEGLESYDAVVIGSAVRMRSWLRSPLRFILSNQEKLRNKQVWLFSSGLLADDPRSTRPRSLRKIEKALGPREHRFFRGSLDTADLGPVHRMVLSMPGVRGVFKVGDDRNWGEIEDWARKIAWSSRTDGSGITMMNYDPAMSIATAGLDRGKEAMERAS